jgi:hypothetical protein
VKFKIPYTRVRASVCVRVRVCVKERERETL